MAKRIDKKVKALVDAAIADGKNKRAQVVLKALAGNGQITSEELNDLGYEHPPRAVADVRDLGIPIITKMVISEKTGKRMAMYSLADSSQINKGRVGGRSAFPKAFKNELIKFYDSKDCITGAKVDAKVLQIDHRIPYIISGDTDMVNLDVKDYMLLDGSSQRTKSWACENCPNTKGPRNPEICMSCYWAFPENYDHIATEEIRRIDIVWQRDEISDFDALAGKAKSKKMQLGDLIKSMLLKGK